MNIHLTPTDKPSRLYYYKNNLFLTTESHFNVPSMKYQNIYITSDEEINLNDYITDGYRVWKWKDDSSLLGRKKVILSTDQDLIQDGVQDIDDDFLEWFIKNPNCEEVETKVGFIQSPDNLKDGFYYKIIIPKKEPKQETLKEEFYKYGKSLGISINDLQRLMLLSKQQQETMYSEEEVLNFTQIVLSQYKFGNTNIEQMDLLKETLQQFKNK
jgi:hypothetical protein